MNRELATQIVMGLTEELWNSGNVGVIPQYYHPDHIGHDPGGFFEGNLERFTATTKAILGAYKNLHVTIQDIMVDDDKVMCRWTVRGQHIGEFNGIAPTGNMVEFTGMNVYRVRGSKVIETWSNSDTLTFMQCMGVVPRFGAQEMEAKT